MDPGPEMTHKLPASEPGPVDLIQSFGGGTPLRSYLVSDVQLPEEGLIWRRYVAVLWRYKWLVVLVTALGTAAGVVGTRFIQPVYEAEATIWIEASRRSDARQGPIQSSELLRSSAWVDLLKSYVVLDHVVRDMRLYLSLKSQDDSAAFASFALAERFLPGDYRIQVSDGGSVVRLTGPSGRFIETAPAGDSLGQQVGFAWAPSRETLPPGATIEFEVANPRDVSTHLGEQTRTRMDLNGSFLRVGFQGSDPEKTAAIVNAVADRYVEVAADLKSAKLEELKDILNNQLEYAWQNLEQAEAALENFRVQTITLPSEPASPVAPGLQVTRDPAFANFFSLKVEEEQLRRDREALESVLVGAADSGVSVEALEVIPAVRSSSELIAAMEELTTKRAELRALQHRYSDDYPTVRDLTTEIEALERGAILDLVADLRDELTHREAELDRLIASASGELSEIPPRVIEEARLERRVEIAENLYTMLRARFEEARLAAASSIPDVRILDAAVPPNEPINRKLRPRLILLAFLGSLGLSVAGVILLDRIDRRLNYPQQVSEQLGLAILGTIPHVAASGRQLGVQNTAEVVEAFRVVRLNLMSAYGSAGPVVVAVTSPSPKDGKSFVSANLALSFADLGRRTLVIDADVRRGHMHRLFGGSRKPGVIDYLAGRATREQVIHPTPYDSLDRIGCGTRRRDGPELLQSSAMAALLAELRPSYDVILIDTSPLAAGVDPLALGTLTGNLVIVVRTGATDRELAESKLDMVDRLPIRILGAVVNDVPLKGVYGYGRYYAAGYETWDEEPVSVWQNVKGGERAPPVENHVSGDSLRPREVYLPNGSSDAGEAEPDGPDEPQASAESAASAGRAGPVEPAPPVEPRAPAKPGRPVEPDSQGPDEGNGQGDGPQAEPDGSEPTDRSLDADQKGGGRQPPASSANGSQEWLQAHAESRVEKFREHQRRHHLRYWK